MTIPRHETVVEGEERVYHCISRCVRRAYLCGQDKVTGKDYSHRKEWVKDRLKFLAENFGVDIIGYAVMSNHLHVIVRVRPDMASGWSKREVALRWLRIFPCQSETNAQNTLSQRAEALAANAERIETIRKRLCSISWFMRCVNETIARKANREDNCKGRFWEGRFKCQALLDEAAILACLAYVDLNPIRAKQAKTLEESAFTSAQDRIVARQAKRKKSLSVKAVTEEQKKALALLEEESQRDAWLCPIEDKPGEDKRGVLPLTLDEYLEVIDRTGRMLRAVKCGAVPADLRPILSRLAIDADRWLEMVERYGGWFYRAVGCVERLLELAQALGCAWLKGISASRRIFAAASG